MVLALMAEGHAKCAMGFPENQKRVIEALDNERE